MASSRLMASLLLMPSSSPANSELARQSSSYSIPAVDNLQSAGEQPDKGFGPMIVDDIVRNIHPGVGGEIRREGSVSVPVSRQGSFALPKVVGEKTVQEVWREITAGRRTDGVGGGGYGSSVVEMTLEDFLVRAESAMEDEARLGSGSSQGGFVASPTIADQLSQQHQQFAVENPALGFGNGSGGRGGRGARGTKRPFLDPMDKAALQRQKRMIKNRESAARSREKKQAYTAELESSVAQLEEENAQLLRNQKMQQRERLKQLMDNLIPVTESRKPRQCHRRTLSMEW